MAAASFFLFLLFYSFPILILNPKKRVEFHISIDNRGWKTCKYISPEKRGIVKRIVFFLLNLGVYPLYTAPRSPWNNGHVEGFNSVFSKKFWNKLQFSDEQEIYVKIKDDFNGVNLENKAVKHFRADKIYLQECNP